MSIAAVPISGVAQQDGQRAFDNKISRLRNALKAYRRALKPVFKTYQDIREEIMGRGYVSGVRGPDQKTTPVNMLELDYTTSIRTLVSSTPQCAASTAFPILKPTARKLETALNHLARKIRLGETIARVVANGLTGIGLCNVGIEYGGSFEYMGFTHDTGRLYADAVPTEDVVFDVYATTLERCTVIGHRVRVPIEAIRQNPRYSADRLKVQPQTMRTDDPDDAKRALSLMGEISESRDEYYEYADIWELYLPMERKTVCVPDGDSTLVLAFDDYNGPPEGPYEFLSFIDVPGLCIPKASLASRLDPHRNVNSMFRKVIAQGRRQKTLTLAQSEGEKDAGLIRDASDGDMIKVQRPDATREARYGGVDNVSLGFAVQLKQLYSYLARNLDLSAGLAPQSDTLGQDRLLNANASAGMRDMQDRTEAFTERLFTRFAWQLMSDPFLDMPVTLRHEATGLELPSRLTATDIQGDYLSYNFQLVPYSLRQPTPAEKLAAIQEVLAALAPYQQIAQQQGEVPNIPAITDMYAKFRNVPEIRDAFMYASGVNPYSPGVPIGQPPSAIPKPQTERTYRRISQSASSMNPDGALVAAAISGNSNPSGEPSA